MPNLNRVMLMGNLTRDPELRYLPTSNTAVVGISIAINRTWKNQQGEQQEEVSFIDCEAFGRTAEVINQYLRKGRPIYVEGRLKLDQWQDKEGGKRSKLKVVVENFQFLDSRQGGPGPAGGGPGSAGSPGSPGDGSDMGESSGPPRNGAPAPRTVRPQGGPPPGAPSGGDPHTPVEEENIPF